MFGVVYVRSTPEEYLKLASDIEALKKLLHYLAIRKFSDPPQLSDLEFTFRFPWLPRFVLFSGDSSSRRFYQQPIPLFFEANSGSSSGR